MLIIFLMIGSPKIHCLLLVLKILLLIKSAFVNVNSLKLIVHFFSTNIVFSNNSFSPIGFFLGNLDEGLGKKKLETTFVLT